jgi:hypothetical protein
MMDLKFLVCEEKNGHVLLLRGAMLHSPILRKPNKMAAFEAAWWVTCVPSSTNMPWRGGGRASSWQSRRGISPTGR